MMTTSQPKRCETCGSDDPTILLIGCSRIVGHDAFHDAPANEPLVDPAIDADKDSFGRMLPANDKRTPSGDTASETPTLRKPHRQICSLCYEVDRVGFWVPNEVWRRALHESQWSEIACLACFTRLADGRGVEWDKEIRFYPISMVRHQAVLQTGGVATFIEYGPARTED